MASAKCPLCHLILRRLPLATLRQNVTDTLNLSFIVNRYAISMWFGGALCGVIQEASEVDPEAEPDRGVVDYVQIRRWISRCESEHGPVCNAKYFTLTRYLSPLDLILIDVQDGRLVKGCSDWRYLVLSYVWGGANILKANTQNFGKLQQKQALSGIESGVAKVIEDAMLLTSRIGERFLWVDALCILQDAPEKHSELAQMDLIFSYALCVIIAVDGESSQSPLPGIGLDTRSPVKPVASILGTPWTSTPGPLASVLDRSKFETRAWTLQERALAKRCLYLSEQQMYFTCNTGEYTETGTLPGILHILSPEGTCAPRITDLREIRCLRMGGRLTREVKESMPSTSSSSGWQMKSQVFMELIETYTSRSLSFPEDILNAFAGFSSLFVECCGGVFVAGIPVRALTMSLFWFPKGRLSKRPVRNGCYFPSWSWAGWQGPVTYASPPRHSVRFMPYSDQVIPEGGDMEIFLANPSKALFIDHYNIHITASNESTSSIETMVVFDSSNRKITLSERGKQPVPVDIPAVEILHLHGPVLSASAFCFFQDPEVPHYPGAVSTVMASIPPSRSRYGFFYFAQESDVELLVAAAEDYKIIVISHHIYSTDIIQHDYRLEGAWKTGEYDQFNQAGLLDKRMLNVLLLRKCANGTFFERVGAGMVMQQFWEKLEPKWEELLIV